MGVNHGGKAQWKLYPEQTLRYLLLPLAVNSDLSLLGSCIFLFVCLFVVGFFNLLG